MGAETFTPKNIMDRVKTFDDACVTTQPTACGTITSTRFTNGDERSVEAYKKLIIITRALNEGWTPDWKNQREYKYYPWFDLSSGSGLSFDGFGLRHSNSFVGSRLCFKSRELAEYAGKQFKKLYEQYFLLK